MNFIYVKIIFLYTICYFILKFIVLIIKRKQEYFFIFPEIRYNINEYNDNNFLEENNLIKYNLGEYNQKYYFKGNCLYLL